MGSKSEPPEVANTFSILKAFTFLLQTTFPLLSPNTHTHTHAHTHTHTQASLNGSDGKESVYSAINLGLIPGWGRFPEEGNDSSHQYSCLENPMDR